MRRDRIKRALLESVALGLVLLSVGPLGVAAAEPLASFLWFPSAPHTGEPVSLVSTSTDMLSPITSLAWDLSGVGAFSEGGPAVSTTFSAAGGHLVQLRVTDASGASSVASETIQVSPPVPIIMEPFPIVRFVASDSGSGARLLLLAVEAPQQTLVTVKCRGRGCPAKSESRLAASRGVGTVTVTFSRFERALRAGVILEIRVFKSGEIGDYTRLSIHHHGPPTRLDECLSPAGIVPIACPSA